jgi:hypothetical protein
VKLKKAGNKEVLVRSLARRARRNPDFGEAVKLLVDARVAAIGGSTFKNTRLIKVCNRALEFIIDREASKSVS